MNAFFLSMLLVFIAEMGDKTQLVTMAFATKYSARVVLTAVTVATLVVHLISVWLGRAMSGVLPVFWINLIAGILFVAFGVWTLRGERIDDANDELKTRLGPFLSVLVTFLLSEIGDKTMLTTVAIAAQQHDVLGVWIGSTVGMVFADGLGIIIGRHIGRAIPERAVKIVASAMFFGFGTVNMVTAFTGRLL